MPDKLKKLPPLPGHIQALAPIIQRWAELCKAFAELEPGAALSWYLQGRADAHLMDASRLREAISPTVLLHPPKEGVSFIDAYETLLKMMQAISQPNTNAPPESP